MSSPSTPAEAVAAERERIANLPPLPSDWTTGTLMARGPVIGGCLSGDEYVEEAARIRYRWCWPDPNRWPRIDLFPRWTSFRLTVEGIPIGCGERGLCWSAARRGASGERTPTDNPLPLLPHAHHPPERHTLGVPWKRGGV